MNNKKQKVTSSTTLESLVFNRKYKQAYEKAKREGTIDELLQLASTNRHCSVACLIIKSEKRSLSDYPQIQARMEKKYVRYLESEFKWPQIELRLMASLQLLAYFVEDTYFNHGKANKDNRNICFSIIERHKLEALISKSELMQELKSEFDYVDNSYLSTDEFSLIISSEPLVRHDNATVFVIV